MKLKGKVALITGAATGIGRASARLFAKEGARIVIVDIRDEEASETVKMIEEAAGEAIFIQADVAVVAELKRAIKTTVDTYGRLDIFYHNAGFAGPGPLELTSEEAFDQTMAVNLKAGFFGAKLAIPEIKKAGGGCILFTSSEVGLHPFIEAPTYSITKAGLIMLTRALAVALAADNIRVNAICPGPVATTALWRDIASRIRGIDPDELTKTPPENRPISRYGTEEEMAAAALFLVSPESSYITGVALPVDGGGAAK